MGKVKNYQELVQTNSRWYWKWTINRGFDLVRNPLIFKILTYTWGLLGVILGYLVLLFCLPFGKLMSVRFSGKKYFFFNKETHWGFSIGTIIFSGKNPQRTLLEHEVGHCYHNAIFGPLIFPLIAIPSLLRFWYRRIIVKLRVKKINELNSYYSVWFEGTASTIGAYDYVVHGKDVI